MQKSFWIIVHGGAGTGSRFISIRSNAKHGHETPFFPHYGNKSLLVAL
jgi:hypothetical protein